VHRYITQDPAVLLARERKMFKFYMDMAEEPAGDVASDCASEAWYRTNVVNVN
jgi:hypothetical protein